ncbi:response regulator [Oceaniglobus roseus]|uniref:response regulator n=1 Tax=Oceaniglobus roseus TaxID=1737570 RepID=UPI000C7ED64B|nr:response regulator [Kandeliimicrobium roseum]
MRDEFLFPCRPTAERPLLGQTVLIVEDSRFASEGVRLMCLRLGARIRRADTLAAAGRHLKVYRPTVVLVDLGLPDGSGLDLIRDLDAARPRVPVLLATSGDSHLRDRALGAGADAFLEKPIPGIEAFLGTILDRLPHPDRPRRPRPVLDEVIVADEAALLDDLSHLANLLGGDLDPAGIEYLCGFLGGLGRSIGDHALTEAAEALTHLQREGRPTGPQVSRIGALVRERLDTRKIAV